MNINFNSADCLKTSVRLTYSEVHNICDGSVTSVPHGFWDYALYVGVIGVLVAFLLLLTGFAVTLFRGY